MDNDRTMRQWLEASNPLVHSLADAAAAEGQLLTVGSPGMVIHRRPSLAG